MLRGTAVLGLFSFASVLAQGCTSKVCTLIGCAFSFEVGFTGATGKPGRYQVDVIADGLSSTCQVTLPWTCETRPTCSAADPPWLLTLSGCALGSDRETLEGIVFHNQGPTSVEFVVRRDDIAVGGGSVQPVYKESRPNGPDCEPVCRSAPRFETEIAP